MPYDILERIWNLADTQQTGALGLPEFIIAMHLLTSYKSGVMRSFPSILPPGFYDAASRLAQSQSSRTPNTSQRRIDASRGQGLPRQFSGNNPQPPQNPMRTASVSVLSLSAQPTGNDWAISPEDIAQFDRIYANVDTTNKGYITGDEAVRFFGNSKLPAEVLAQIWDLACINGNGQLNREEFAVAMYLIRQQRSARDGSNVLPTTLPPSLVPPSMRRQAVSPTPPAFPTFDEKPNTRSKSAAEDLFGLDAFSEPAPTQPQSTGGSSAFNVNKSSSPLHSSPQQTQPPSIFKPFVPSSSFGQAIVSSNPTGVSSASNPSQIRQPQQRGGSVDDLLGDDDPEISKRLTAETAEIANVSNQINNLSQQMQDTKSKKQATETELANATSQKQEYESKLAQLRTVYEREVQDVRNLEEQLNNCRNEIKKLLRDVAMIEGSYEDIKNQHRQAVNALEADQRENTELKEKIRKINSEIDQLRPELEKLKLDSRQQKGLVAINKKQLSTSENERDRLKSEIEETSKTIEPIARRQTSPTIASPATSAASQSTNPFVRNLPAQTSDNPSSPVIFNSDRAAPFQPGHGSFDDIFGPSPSQTPSLPPPPTSFRVDSGAKDVQPRSVKTEPFEGFPSGKEEHQEPSPFDEPPSLSQVGQTSSANVSVRGEEPIEHENLSGKPGNRDKDITSEVEPVRGNEESERSTAESNIKDSSGIKSDDHHTSPLSSFSPLKFFRDMIPSAFPGGSDSQDTQAPKAEAKAEDKGKRPELPSTQPDTITEPGKATSVKDDFDSAFAEFDTPKQSQGSQSNGVSSEQILPKRTNKIDNEFPPIRELDNDDDSDSSSERRFDDNFTPVSPRQGQNTLNHDGAGDHQGPPRTTLLNSRPALLETMPREEDQLPTPGAEASPPSYKQSMNTDMGGGSGKSHFPREFTGLLPPREDPTRDETPIASSVTTVDRDPLAKSTPATSGAPLAPSVVQKTSPPRNTSQASTPDESYQLAPSYLQTNKDQSQSSQVLSVGQWDDEFDRDFTDLADAKEEADEKDVQNQFGGLSGSSELGGSFATFNPVFDSPEGSGINQTK